MANPDTKILDGKGDSAVIVVDKGRTIQGLRERGLESWAERQLILESQKEAEEAMA